MTPDAPHLLIRAGTRRYLLPVAAVAELLPVPDCSPVPRTPEWLAGVSALHGELVAVVDLARFAGSADPTPPTQCLLFDRSVACLALLVSGVEQMVAGPAPADPDATRIDPELLVAGLEEALASPLPPARERG